LRSTGPQCTSTPARSDSRASSPKCATAAIRPARGNDWVKKTCQQRETLPIAGFALKANKFDGIYLGRLKGSDLVYAGKVDNGFDKSSTADLQARLKPLIRKTQPYAKKIAHRGIWVEPSLLAEIEYRAKSAEGKVRHPFFKGIREDL
jgi:bifunctional non-homologous end joining protein LigD